MKAAVRLRGLGADSFGVGDCLAAAFGEAHAESVGRWQRDLTAEQLADVEAEAGDILAQL